jgi:hypothetical protein
MKKGPWPRPGAQNRRGGWVRRCAAGKVLGVIVRGEHIRKEAGMVANSNDARVVVQVFGTDLPISSCG